MNDPLLENKELLFLEPEPCQRRLIPIIVIIKENIRNAHPIQYSFVMLPLYWTRFYWMQCDAIAKFDEK
jgi:hypothetical protein